VPAVADDGGPAVTGFVPFLLRRLAQALPTIVIVVSAVFFTIRLAPGDPAAQMLGLHASPAAVAMVREELGLDRPLWQQYGRFWGDLVRGDLGISFRTREPVVRAIGVAFGYTIQLAASALALAALLGVPLGIVAATTRHPWLDRGLTGFSSLALATPVFWLGLLMMLLFALQLGWLPSSGAGTWRHLVMPAAALSLASMAHIMRLTRASLLEAMGQPFVTVARSKGLGERRLVLVHGLRNALLPVVTQVGLQFGNLLGGSILTETVFAWPGLGRLVVTAVYARDYPTIQAAVIALALIYIGVNLVVDLVYSYLDPRIQLA